MSLVSVNLAGVRGPKRFGVPIYSYKCHQCNPYPQIIRFLTSRSAGNSKRCGRTRGSGQAVLSPRACLANGVLGC